MDHSISGLSDGIVTDGDLIICDSLGMAWQKDMRVAVEYGSAYWSKVRSYEGSDVSSRVISGRLSMLSRHAERGAKLIDYGCGSGEFVRAAVERGFAARGYEVMPEGIESLLAHGLYAGDVSQFDVVTMWDVIEHLEYPHSVLWRLKLDAVALFSIPVFSDLRRIRESKHYRPGEHLYYWTCDGFVRWLRSYGYSLLEYSDHETIAGRESIGAFAFRRVL